MSEEVGIMLFETSTLYDRKQVKRKFLMLFTSGKAHRLGLYKNTEQTFGSW
jgi:hypothetical protein